MTARDKLLRSNEDESSFLEAGGKVKEIVEELMAKSKQITELKKIEFKHIKYVVEHTVTVNAIEIKKRKRNLWDQEADEKLTRSWHHTKRRKGRRAILP